ncbi:MAG TPA: transcriptional repressor LexA [Terriglobales bacterium]|nr:transcriptional repressor LexA [Terriglobales bacterium]
MLNDRAREILSYIRSFQQEHGLPPTIREIGKAFEISSTNGVRYYLTMLEKAGYLKRRGKVSRGSSLLASTRRAGVPLVGRVAAGRPILAEECVEDLLDVGTIFGEPSGLFALRVRGDSMVEAGILDRDLVIVRQREQANPGDIIVALVGTEATVKYYRPRGNTIELAPANAKYEPISVTPDHEFRILGIVTGVLRTVGGRGA